MAAVPGRAVARRSLSDGPTAPLEVAWRHSDIAIEDADVTGGLSSPVVSDDGTIVVVGPHEVLGFDGEDGSRGLHRRHGTSDRRSRRRSDRAPTALSWCSRRGSATGARPPPHLRPRPPRHRPQLLRARRVTPASTSSRSISGRESRCGPRPSPSKTSSAPRSRSTRPASTSATSAVTSPLSSWPRGSSDGRRTSAARSPEQ